MDLRSEALLMCDYNRWAYTILQTAVAAVDDNEYFANKGLFFKSIHGILNHLLLVDYFWHGRFVKKLFKINGLDDQLIVKREEIFPAIFAQCQVWRDLIAHSDIDTFASSVCYVDTKGTQQVKPFFASLLLMSLIMRLIIVGKFQLY